MNVLVVAAHPDDEVLGAGATIARHVSQGDNVTIAILGEGATSRYQSEKQVAEQAENEVARLRSHARNAAQILGAYQVQTFSFPDNCFDSVPLLKIVKEVENLVQQTDPEIVYTHFWGDLNIDHVLTCKATLTACRPKMDGKIKKLLAFEIPSSTEWGTKEVCFSPNVFVDVHHTLDVKLEAMRAYETEMREFPHPRSMQALIARARHWGAVVGLLAAEPFMQIREIIV